MELSTENYQKHRDFQILLASSVLILGMYSFQDILFTPNSTPVNDVEIFQLDITPVSTQDFYDTLPFAQDNIVEYTGVVAYNQTSNLYILQTGNGSEYILSSSFADFLELVGEKVTVGGNLSGDTIEVNKVQVL